MHAARLSLPWPLLSLWLLRILAFAIAALFAYFVFVALEHMGAEFARPGPRELIPALMGVPLGIWLLRRFSNSKYPGRALFLSGITLLFVATRGAAILWIPAAPVSDFASNVRLAEFMAGHGDFPTAADDPLFFPWGYSFLLSLLARSGLDVLTVAHALNVVCGTVSLWLLYVLVENSGQPNPAGWGARSETPPSRPWARIAAILFLLWPAQLFLTPVVASEHPALALTLGVLVLLQRAAAQVAAQVPRAEDLPTGEGRGVGRAQRNPPLASAGLPWLLFTGLLLSLAALVRPALLVLLPLCGVYFLLLGLRWRALVMLALLAFMVFGTQCGFAAVMERTYGRRPPSVAWWNLLAGLNAEARGRWNEADAAKFFSFTTLEEGNYWARQEIGRRLVRKPLEQVQLARRKLRLLWGDNYYGAWWATQELRPSPQAERVAQYRRALFIASQFFHIPLLALTALGAWRIARGAPATSAAVLALLLIASGTLLHTVFETQTRYAHVFTAGAIVLAGWAVSAARKPAVTP